ncbi:hypothetical protein DCC85_04310 [Paenibacillus sp. CAA11]|uniref:hypothetical protein n=1 Tax=Paenibacillus sp. CAA11 TaxID=1532905 RepID=UPI000D3D4099|nr:hypothetical protein [Paenibacillus sp. CAA11]AWB43521.1 hypothetical protein DCC85_04310 [Paenibacillus sp. CAA11]
MDAELYFKDNFFNSGMTEVMDPTGQVVGALDLKSAFGSSIDVYNSRHELECSGKFRFTKWKVEGQNGSLLGVLRERMSFFSKRYEYDTDGRGTYEIKSPAFSREYVVRDIVTGELAAEFAEVNGWLRSSAYRLQNYSSRLNSSELIAVVMGVNEIQKRHNHDSAGTHTP